MQYIILKDSWTFLTLIIKEKEMPEIVLIVKEKGINVEIDRRIALC
jgi:hypothetical protein